jgi:hypothetical protein
MAERKFLLAGVVVLAALALYMFIPANEPSISPTDSGEKEELVADGLEASEGEPIPVTENRTPSDVEGSSAEPEPAGLWYEKHSLMEKARLEYPNQLAAVWARVEEYSRMDRGAAAIERSIAHGYHLFDTEEFPLTKEDVSASEELAKVDLANALSELAGNRRRTGRWLDEFEPAKLESTIKAMNRDPLNYPPSLLMQAYLPTGRPELDPDFVLDARDLYLKAWPSLYDARRDKSVGISATVQTLEVLGVDGDEVGNTFKEYGELSPEVQAGEEREGAIERDFLLEFQALVQKYYS